MPETLKMFTSVHVHGCMNTREHSVFMLTISDLHFLWY